MSLAGAKGVERPSEHRLGVLFEISIVCHVLCSWFWRGGWGFSLFLGGCSGLSVVFSRASGVSCVSRSFCSCCWGGWRVAGGSGVRGSVRPGGLLPFCWGVGWGVRLRAPECLASSLLGGRVRVARVARFPWWGSGCARFPVRVRGVLARVRGGFSGVVFSVRCFSCSSGFRCWSSWSCRGLGGCGGCRVGLGLFFLRLLLYWPGPVWVWVGFCLESLILAQDERWRRA